MAVASLVLKPRLPKIVKSHNFQRYISDMIFIKIVPLISALGKTPLTASPVVSDTDRTEGGRLIFAKFGQCGQHTSQRSPIRSKTIFVTRFGHQEALQFFTIQKLKLQFKPCLSMNQFFFFCGLKGGLKLFTNKQKNFGSGPFLILHGHQKVFCTYVEHGPTGWPTQRFSSKLQNLLSKTQILG